MRMKRGCFFLLQFIIMQPFLAFSVPFSHLWLFHLYAGLMHSKCWRTHICAAVHATFLPVHICCHQVHILVNTLLRELFVCCVYFLPTDKLLRLWLKQYRTNLVPYGTSCHWKAALECTLPFSFTTLPLTLLHGAQVVTLCKEKCCNVQNVLLHLVLAFQVFLDCGCVCITATRI